VIDAAIPPADRSTVPGSLSPPGISFFPVEESCFMLALQLRLDFSCCACGHAVGVTLKCEGSGLADNPVTPITIGCPTCNQSNQIWFTPEDGRVHRVTRERQYAGIPEPSWN
jgi:hypothetical protein